MSDSKRILVVDDEIEWREHIMREALEDAGYLVQTGSTYAEAVAALNCQCFDLAIVDVNLTGVSGNQDGIRFVARFAKDGAQRPAIVISGSKMLDAAAQRVMELGCVTFIDKTNFDVVDFLNAVDRLSRDSRESIQ